MRWPPNPWPSGNCLTSWLPELLWVSGCFQFRPCRVHIPATSLRCVWMLAPFLWTLEFWPYLLKHWYSGPILSNIGTSALSFQTLEFRPYFYEHWNSTPSFQRLEFCPCSFKHWNFVPVISKFEFQPYPFKHWNCGLIFINTGIRTWSLQALFRPCPFKHWNSCPIFINTGIPALFVKTLVLWPHTFKHWNSGPLFLNIGILALFFKLNVTILLLSFQTLKFWSSFYKHLNSSPILSNTGIPALSFQTYLVFRPYSFKHGILALSLYSGLIFINIGILPYPFKHWNSRPILSNSGILALFL